MFFNFSTEQQKQGAMAELDIMGVTYSEIDDGLDIDEEFIGGGETLSVIYAYGGEVTFSD